MNITGEWRDIKVIKKPDPVQKALSMIYQIDNIPYPVISNGSVRLSYFDPLRITGAWNWYHISCIINVSDVITYPNRPWCRFGLSHNKGITVNVIDSLNRLRGVSNEWNWSDISRIIDIKEVVAHPDRPWDRHDLSQNESITLAVIESLVMSNAVSRWNWCLISSVIDIKEVIAHPDRPWDRQGLSHNRGLTVDIMRCLDNQYTHELVHVQYPKIEYKQSYLCDISIVCQ